MPLLWTHLIPATLGRQGDAQRAERDVRRAIAYSMGVARRHPARAADLRHDLLPGAGPDEHLRRAPVQGDPRLRPQPGAVQAMVGSGRQPGSPTAGAWSSSRPLGIAATRTSTRSHGHCAGCTSITTSVAATTIFAAATATRYRGCCEKLSSTSGVDSGLIELIPREVRRQSIAPSVLPGLATCC